jgi:light-regulated signal transduction histidine kinase (bacteriophytochrome)
VPHDLRAPLRTIEGFSRIVLEDHGATLDAEARRCVERVGGAATRLHQLIDDLLLLAQISRREIRRRPVDVRALAETIAGERRASQPERQTVVVVAPGVAVDVETRDGTTALVVRDDGAGFDMAYRDRLSRPFQRLHSSDDFEGTGIGLAIVERIVRRHGGHIEALAAPEQGATFALTLGPGAVRMECGA